MRTMRKSWQKSVHALDVEFIDIPADATPGLLSFMMAPHTLGRGWLVAIAQTPA